MPMVTKCCCDGCDETYVDGGPVTFHKDLCILLPASPEPQQTRADDERSGNGTNPGGESDKVKRDSATNKMEWGVLTKKKSGQSHRGENHDYSVCLTVNLKDFFGSEAVPQGSSVGESRVVSGDDSSGSRVGQPATLLPPWYTHCHCTVYRCATNYHEIPGVTYHSFPKDEWLRREWLARCGRSDKVNMRHARVCSVHFRPEDYERDLMNELLGLPLRKKLIPTAVPTLNLPSPQEDDITECTKECKYTSVKQEPVEDLDKPSCSATEQECEYMFVKREPEGDLDKAICSANEEFLEDPGLYIKQDPELNLDVDGSDNNEFQYIEVKEEPPRSRGHTVHLVNTDSPLLPILSSSCDSSWEL